MSAASYPVAMRVNRFRSRRAAAVRRRDRARSPVPRRRRCPSMRDARVCWPPSASRGPRRAAWPTSWTPWPARSGQMRATRSRRRSTSTCRATGASRSPTAVERTTTVRVPGPAIARRAPARSTLVDVPADGYRLRLVDHPPAFDRDGFYGDAAGDYPDNAWRFGLFCRAALEAIRPDGGRSTCSTSTTGTPGRRRSPRRPLRRTIRSSAMRRS